MVITQEQRQTPWRPQQRPNHKCTCIIISKLSTIFTNSRNNSYKYDKNHKIYFDKRFPPPHDFSVLRKRNQTSFSIAFPTFFFPNTFNISHFNYLQHYQKRLVVVIKFGSVAIQLCRVAIFYPFFY